MHDGMEALSNTAEAVVDAQQLLLPVGAHPPIA